MQKNSSNSLSNSPVNHLLSVVGGLAKAVRSQSDLHFGLYHSLFEWFHPLYKEDKANNFQTRKFVQVSCISVKPVINICTF